MFSWLFPKHPRLKELASLPKEIDVAHAPNPVPAQWEREGGKSVYRWVYRTTVWTDRTPVQVVEFGSFSWHLGRWVFANFTGQPFSSADFGEWYSCPDGRLCPGESATDPSNWTGGEARLTAGKMLWYFIGVDHSGRRVKGEAVINLLGKTG